jgi:hypothetical protein
MSFGALDYSIDKLNNHVEKISEFSSLLNSLLDGVNSEMPRLRKESSDILGHILPLYKLKTKVFIFISIFYRV